MCGGCGGAARAGIVGGAIVRSGHWALWAIGATLAKRRQMQYPCGGGRLVRALVRWTHGAWAS